VFKVFWAQLGHKAFKAFKGYKALLVLQAQLALVEQQVLQARLVLVGQ